MARRRGRPAAEALELARDLGADGRRVVGRHDLVDGAPRRRRVDPLAEVDVQAEPSAGAPARRRRPPPAPRRAHHQARARDDALLVGAHDAAVDARAEAEVVGVDDRAAGVRSRRRSAPALSSRLGEPVVRVRGRRRPVRRPAEPLRGDEQRGRRRARPQKLAARRRARAARRGRPRPAARRARCQRPAVSAARSSSAGPAGDVSQSTTQTRSPAIRTLDG